MPPDRFTVTSSHHGDGSRSPHDVGARPRANTTPVRRMRRTSTAGRCANQSARRFPSPVLTGSGVALSAFRLSGLSALSNSLARLAGHIHRRATFDPALTSGSSPRRPASIHRHARQECSFKRSTICSGTTGHAAQPGVWPDMTATAVAGEKADQRHLLGQAGFVADNRCGRISATTRRGGRGRPCRSMDDAACSSPWPRSGGSARG